MANKNIVFAFLFAFLLVASVGFAATTAESTGEYVDDSIITAKVKVAILQESSLKSLEINVETYKGVVQLSGFVSTQANIDLAVRVALTVAGVQSVKNDMRLK
jgi:osmotically-inducible protein OsmY